MTGEHLGLRTPGPEGRPKGAAMKRNDTTCFFTPEHPPAGGKPVARETPRRGWKRPGRTRKSGVSCCHLIGFQAGIADEGPWDPQGHKVLNEV